MEITQRCIVGINCQLVRVERERERVILDKFSSCLALPNAIWALDKFSSCLALPYAIWEGLHN